ncbi:uncharacterized protein LOC134827090 [Culicoides brevitarsis]|uniref:uncharacterized protein LOC134827090 n=1 Tax=Culicoides brevitarsis TaxID=469753 RepID=UPI00307B76A0
MENGKSEELTWNNLPEIAKRALKIVAKQQNFVSYNVKIASGSSVGDGYMSVIVRATIIGTKSSENITHEFPVLCKMQVVSKARREFSNSNALFKREIAMYKDYLPELEKIQREYGVSTKEGFFNYPKCYYAEFDDATDDGILVMNDIRDEGYAMVSKYEPLDIAVIRLVVQQLAKLHALSFVFERKKPEIFAKFKKYEDLMEQIMVQPATVGMWNTVFPVAINSLQGKHPKIEEKLKKLRENLAVEYKYLTNPENSGKYSVLGHGDSWSNNFMFKFGPSKIPNDVMVLDWQLSRYASPILDLAYFLFTSTDKPTRDAHYANLLKLYHETFGAFLEKFGEQSERIFPFSAFQEEWKKFGKLGLLHALLILGVVTISTEDLPDMDKSMDELMDPNAKENAQSAMMKAAEANLKKLEPRIRDIVLDIDRFGYNI